VAEPGTVGGLGVGDRGAVRVLTIDRPERSNAVDSTTLVALRDELLRGDADPGVRVLVLTGAGPAFCAGIDLKEEEPPGTAEQRRRWRGRLAEVFLAADGLGTPLLCQVNGPAVGGGVGLAAMGHLCVAADTAWFALTEIDVGRWPLAVGAVLLRLMPAGAVRELAMTARRLPASEACRLGLVSRVVPAGELEEAVRALAVSLAGKPPAAMAAGLTALRRMASLPLADAFELGLDTLDELLATEEAREGQARFSWARPVAYRREAEK
jgi:enoyl-CoA hydratase/carnithine racemase